MTLNRDRQTRRRLVQPSARLATAALSFALAFGTLSTFLEILEMLHNAREIAASDDYFGVYWVSMKLASCLFMMAMLLWLGTGPRPSQGGRQCGGGDGYVPAATDCGDGGCGGGDGGD